MLDLKIFGERLRLLRKERKLPLKKIAELLGDSEKMVMEVYNHIVLEKEDAAGAVADALRM